MENNMQENQLSNYSDEHKLDNDNTIDVQMNDNLFKFIELSDSNTSSSLTGTPKNVFIDIVKRFCKNYVAILSLLIILAISFIAVIVPAVSPYSSTKPASDASLEWITNMPPSYSPIVTEVLDQKRLSLIKSIQDNNPNLKIIYETIDLGAETRITYDKYLLVSNLSEKKINANFLLGTNNVGIDIWTRTWAATRDSITLAFLVATTDAIIGITIGAILGFHAGTWIDTVFTRIIDVIINIPTLIWFLMLITITPVINQFTLYLILISIGWVYMVHNTRLWVITVKDQEFIMAAKSIGASKTRQIFIHALPTVIGKLATNYVRRIVIVILSLSSLTFLGFLPVTGDPNLGTLLQEARIQVEINIWTLLLPSLILLLFSLSSQFVANGLHDALDPKVGRGK